MTIHITWLIALVIVAIAGFAAGMVVARRQLFPFHLSRKLFNALKDGLGFAYGPWSIGIYSGPDPFELTDAPRVRNPVLTAKDVTDIDARFVADPFLVLESDRSAMFFEVMNRATGRGEIGYATSTDNINWTYGGIVIREDFHLSYPYVFKWESDYYLIPESGGDFSLRLYVATSFPDKWEYSGDIMGGQKFVDASLFRYKDKWWLFSSPSGSAMLNIYHSDDLRSGWRPHAMNPVVEFDKHTARPAGRVLVHDGRIYRFAQDDAPSYGIQVFAFEIVELSEDNYAERPVSEQPVITRSGRGWNAAGMHHMDVQQLEDGGWIAAVDGRDR